ncbi:hypothetical protein TNCV_5059871 [Trichonephila clavipes]|nr:hypothetical protein TNCV_5059871 [Trichonephila clavipes]
MGIASHLLPETYENSWVNVQKDVPCLNWGSGDRGVAIYRPFGEFHRANSYFHLYGAQGQDQQQTGGSSPFPQ